MSSLSGRCAFSCVSRASRLLVSLASCQPSSFVSGGLAPFLLRLALFEGLKELLLFSFDLARYPKLFYSAGFNKLAYRVLYAYEL